MGVIDDYIAGFEEPAASRLREVVGVIRDVMPDADETISWRMPTFKLGGKNAIHVAGYAKHVGLYPSPEPIIAFADQLDDYPHAKGSVQFPHNRPLPIGLIRRFATYQADRLRPS